MASGTSSWVSKQHGPIPAPMATRMSSGRAPKRRPISPTVLAGRSRAVPRHPAWTAPTDRVTGSWSSRMMQSAEKTIRLSPGSSVTRASAVMEATYPSQAEEPPVSPLRAWSTQS